MQSFLRKVFYWSVAIPVTIFLALLAANAILGPVEGEGRRAFTEKGKKRVVNLREPRNGLRGYAYPAEQDLARSKGLEDKSYTIATDEHGIWLPNSGYKQAELNLFFLGGSTTASVYTTDTLRFPVLVGKKLREQTGRKVHSYNAGYSANHSMHSNTTLLTKVLGLKPDVAVLMHACNDLGFLATYGDYWTDTARNLNLIRVDKSDFNRKSVLYKAYKTWFPHIYHRSLKSKTTPDKDRGVVPAMSIAKMHKAFTNSLSTFVAICRANGITPVLMTQGHILDTDHEVLRRYYSSLADPAYKHQMAFGFEDWKREEMAFNAIVRHTADSLQVPLVDLEKALSGCTACFYDPYHLNDTGSVKTATVISDSFAQWRQSGRLTF